MQNLMTFNLSNDQLADIDSALQLLETRLAGLKALDPTSKARLHRLGAGKESFCRQALETMAENPALVPPDLDVADALADLNTRNQLRPRLTRLAKLLERGNDTLTALGSDAIVTATQCYGLLKLVGKTAGLQSKRKELAVQFKKPRRKEDAKVA